MSPGPVAARSGQRSQPLRVCAPMARRTRAAPCAATFPCGSHLSPVGRGRSLSGRGGHCTLSAHSCPWPPLTAPGHGGETPVVWSSGSGPGRHSSLVLDRKLWRGLERKARSLRCAQSPGFLCLLALSVSSVTTTERGPGSRHLFLRVLEAGCPRAGRLQVQ